MSVEDEIAADTEAIKQHLGILSDADAPKTTEDARRMAAEAPDKFTALLDQGLIPGEVLAGPEEE